MGSGGGSNPISDGFKNPLGALANLAVNASTMGTVGYDSDNNKFQLGYATHAGDETLGSITGRNLARDQAAAADARVNAEAAQKQADLLAQQKQDQQNDILASNSARGIRRTAAAQTLGSSGGSANDYSPAQDFLGL